MTMTTTMTMIMWNPRLREAATTLAASGEGAVNKDVKIEYGKTCKAIRAGKYNETI